MIPVPAVPSSGELAPSYLEQCKAETRIDYEGMHDAQCSLRVGHPGVWHYVAPDGEYSDEIWFRPGKTR